MTDGELLKYMGTDAAKWAQEFCKIARDHGQKIDEEIMIGWFANAIMAGHDAATGMGPVELPDGSGVAFA